MKGNSMNQMGDSDQITREYFDSILIETRHIDSVIPSTTLKLYGKTFDTPIMTAALSHLKGRKEDGMIEMARGAYAAKTVMWAGMGDENAMDGMTATGAQTIKIIKPYADEELIFKKLEHAEKAGALAVGMDIDHSFNKKGEYDTVLGFSMKAKTCEDLKRYINATKLPFIIKGVLSEQDAYKCLEIGAQGIVVSHHHGIMDYSVPPLMILEKITKVVNKRIPVFVDCCIETGIDAFKALALGASAVCVGRALMKPFADKGPEGVTQRIEEMTAELSGIMARTCSKDIDNIDSTVIWKK